jgi:hypothetical protein
MKEKIIILLNASLLCFLGLWDLFSLPIADLEKTGLIAIFPRVYHIVISALLLFLFPMLNPKNHFWFLLMVLLSTMVSLTILTQLFTATARFTSLLVLFITNLLLNCLAYYVIVLKTQTKYRT